MTEPSSDQTGPNPPRTKTRVIPKGQKAKPLSVYQQGTCDDDQHSRYPDKCPSPCLCYVNSRQTTLVSKSFTRNMINQHKDESVAVRYSDGTLPGWIEGSGTLISPNLVLTSYHALRDIDIFISKKREENENVKAFNPTNLKVLFDLEYTDPDHIPSGITTPTLARYQEYSVLGIKKMGTACVDFALLVLSQSMDMARVATISNRPVNQGEDIIVFQHPKVSDSEKMNYPQMVTRVSGGSVHSPDCVDPPDPSCQAYACANYYSRKGSSGGGVYDKNMILIGVVKGRTSMGTEQFVKMSHIVPQSKFLTANITGNVKISVTADLSNDNP